MNLENVPRTQRLKILYLLTLAVLSAFSITVLSVSGWSPWGFLIIFLLLLIPGRVQGHYYRSFFRGRRLQSHGNLQAAIEEYQHFTQDIQHRPWIKRLLWLTWSIYTVDIEAMTRNNIGACYLGIGQFQQAEEELRQATQLDPQSPLPHYNLAVLAQVQGHPDQAEQEYASAQCLGYNRDSFDQMIATAGELLARLEGRIPRNPNR